MEEQEHEVYGGDIPDEGEMDPDVDMSRPEDDDPNSKVSLSLSISILIFVVVFEDFFPNLVSFLGCDLGTGFGGHEEET